MNPSSVAIVTGGAGAFGSAISHRLVEAGHHVVIADINLDQAQQTAASLNDLATVNAEGAAASPTSSSLSTHAPGSASAVHLDLCDDASITHLIEETTRTHGRLDVLVNNAGYSPAGGLDTTSIEDFDRTMQINLRGVYLLCVAALPLLKASPAARAVFVGSRTWLAGGNPAYTASKAGVVGLSRTVVHALGPTGGTSNVVAPGPVDTPLVDQMNMGSAREENFRRYAEATPLGRVATAADVAAAVAFFAGPDASFITGEVLHVTGGLQLAPRL